MNQHYNENYSREDVAQLLERLQTCVRHKRYHVALNPNRQENVSFRRDYHLSPDRVEDILLGMDVTDFCHSLKNLKPGFEYEVLYVFCPTVPLYHAIGGQEAEEASIFT